jgi:hypothetical protein
MSIRGTFDRRIGEGDAPDIRGIVMEMTLTDRAEALFASPLQPSDRPGPEQIEAVARTTLRVLGAQGCAAVMAAEFGEHPETAADRMRWALALARMAEPALGQAA